MLRFQAATVDLPPGPRMIVRNVPLIFSIAVPVFLVSKETKTIVSQGGFDEHGYLKNLFRYILATLIYGAVN